MLLDVTMLIIIILLYIGISFTKQNKTANAVWNLATLRGKEVSYSISTDPQPIHFLSNNLVTVFQRFKMKSKVYSHHFLGFSL